MTGLPKDEERDLLAAEYALGLLDGDALRQARVLAATDPDFAAAAAAWQTRLAPLLDALPAVEPGPKMWERISRAIAQAPRGAANVVDLGKRLRLWRAYAAGVTALAASLALLIGYEATRNAPGPVPIEAPAAAVILKAPC